ncbi:GGDEF domain-containing protein [Pseudomonas sp. SST3]|uniref:GGDEF domain-containing protein n=1 Tax=Pseudomonas sp. SST3 TaxID=2267882 RepID=UPI000E0511B0|nr:GGDEF domain-containing protein [Pseudomonas sp. SST3]NKQ09955.1 GGDEF domain-containing protein [Pseudomonas sp. SST3]
MPSVLDRLLNRLASLLPGEFDRNDLKQLVDPQGHSFLLSQCRATLILRRARAVALLFVVLIPAWSLIDLVAFTYPLWIGLATFRLVACAGLVCLLLFCRPNGTLFDAYRAIAALFVIPAVFHFASQMLLTAYPHTEIAAVLASGYAVLPVVVMAGLALFPLTLLESLVVALAVLVAQALVGYVSWETLSWPDFIGNAWLLLLVAAVAALAGMSQLAFTFTLVRQTIRDPLTGVFSRGSGQEILQLQWNVARRNDTGLALAFIDLDHFSSINDTWDHEAGNQVMCECTRNMLASLRSSDSVLRWGGNAFVVVMPDTDMEQARRAMERLVQRGLARRPDGQPLTASIGLAERCFDFAESHLGLLEAACARMRRAKAEGRNRLSFGADAEDEGIA